MSHIPSISRAILLCADDYALHPLVDDAVQQLARAGRLSATSCMTTSPQWRQAAPALKPLRPLLSVGLHFNLTESHGDQHTAQTLGQVIRQAYCHQMSSVQMRTAWRDQLDAFEQAMGTPPDFIDGHQHVHQLPGLRTAMLEEMQSRYAAHEMPWVRSTAPAAGLWRGPDAASYGAQMAAWLPHMAGSGLLMCHPASGIVAGDAIGQQRPVEFGYLMADTFDALLQRNGCRIHQGPMKAL